MDRKALRLRRRATVVKALGWTVLGLSIALACGAAIGSGDDDLMIRLSLVAAAVGICVLLLSHAIGWLVEKYADHVITRGRERRPVRRHSRRPTT